jgi:hypothetical protein
MAVFAFCYQLTIPDSVDRMGKTLVYTEPGNGSASYISLDTIQLEGAYGPEGITYYFCAAQGEPTLLVFGQISDFSSNGMTLTGGTSACTSNFDCAPGNNGGGNGGAANCYQIQINTLQVGLPDVEFQYTAPGARFSTLVLAENWLTYTTASNSRTVYVCSETFPTILLYGEPIFNPADYGVTVTGGTSSCTSDADCAPAQNPVNCTLSAWGYGATQETWVSGAWSPCQLINGSYQRFQTRYVITPASGGGTCNDATIQYEACTPPQSGTVPTVATPTASSITASTATVSTTITNNGGSTVTLVRFRLYQNSVLVSTLSIDNLNLGISVQFTGLTASTQYTVEAVATNSTGSGTSQAASFTTSGNSSISTPTTSNLTQTGVTLSSTFTNSSGDTYARYGIIYKTGNADNLVNGAAGVIRVETGALTPNLSPASLVSQLTGLVANTQYYAKAYVQHSDGTSFLYSSAANFTTTSVPVGENLAEIGITTLALPQSTGTAESYRYITSSPASTNRSYLSVIESTGDDPEPGVYSITTNFQRVDTNSLVWILERKFSPSDTAWQTVTTVSRSTELGSLQRPEGWTYYEYQQDLSNIKFRPAIPGYYRIVLKGNFSDSTQFNLNRELVIGRPVSDIGLAYNQLRQGTTSTVQVTTQPDSPEWIPEFSVDNLYSVTVTQTGTTLATTFIPNNVTRSFSALWATSSNNQQVTPTLTVTYNSPFKNLLLSNSFSKQIQVTVLPPFPIIDFANLQIFTNPINSGSNITFSATSQYVENYGISSSLGTGLQNSPVTYNNVGVGTYDITVTGTNNSNGTVQTVTSTRTITVEPAAPIVSQLPQQSVGRNLYIDINTLPFVNLNGSTFSSLAITTNPSQGTINLNNYTIRYIPNLDYTGTDLFSFRVRGPGNISSNIVNVSVLVSAPSFNVGSANEPIVFNSTEIGATRDLVVPITNNGTASKLEIHSITLDQDSDEFKLVLTSGQTETVVSSIDNIDVNPGETYNVKVRVQPAGIGVRSAKLKIDHN